MVESNQTVNVNTVKSKLKTKKALHLFLAFEAGAYLPGCDKVTTYFLKDLYDGKKLVGLPVCFSSMQYVESRQILPITVPFYEQLRVSDFLEMMRENVATHRYFPEERDLHR